MSEFYLDDHEGALAIFFLWDRVATKDAMSGFSHLYRLDSKYRMIEPNDCIDIS